MCSGRSWWHLRGALQATRPSAWGPEGSWRDTREWTVDETGNSPQRPLCCCGCREMSRPKFHSAVSFQGVYHVSHVVSPTVISFCIGLDAHQCKSTIELSFYS